MNKVVSVFILLLFFGMLLMWPLFLVRLKAALKLAAAIYIGLLLWWRLTPPVNPVDMGLANLAVGLVVLGTFLAALLRIFLHGSFEREKASAGVEDRSRMWTDSALALWASGVLSLITFVALSRLTRGLSDPLPVHSGLAIASTLVLLFSLLPWRIFPAFGLFWKMSGIGAGAVVLLLTAYSWTWYPAMVRREAESASNSGSYCIYFPESRSVARPDDKLTFLTLAKRRSNGHFFLVSQENVWEWSYYKRSFVPDPKANFDWFYTACSNLDGFRRR